MMAQEKYIEQQLINRMSFMDDFCLNRDLLDAKANNSDDSDDEAPGGGDYTVYECPGLAPVRCHFALQLTSNVRFLFYLQTGEMEVRNPLFSEPDSSIVIPPANAHYSQPSTSPPREKSLP